ncbi:MAG: hypothetical protein Q7R87_01500 [Nanoarchaeota archaeon]|nr:hypothetical protein [Nanoarchaeota archaeon]
MKNKEKSKSKKLLSVDERFKRAREIHNVLMKKIKDGKSLMSSINKKEVYGNKFKEDLSAIQDQVNYLKIGRAKLEAEIESLNIELEELLK